MLTGLCEGPPPNNPGLSAGLLGHRGRHGLQYSPHRLHLVSAVQITIGTCNLCPVSRLEPTT